MPRLIEIHNHVVYCNVFSKSKAFIPWLLYIYIHMHTQQFYMYLISNLLLLIVKIDFTRNSRGRKSSLVLYKDDDANDLSDLGIGASDKSLISEDYEHVS